MNIQQNSINYSPLTCTRSTSYLKLIIYGIFKDLISWSQLFLSLLVMFISVKLYFIITKAQVPLPPYFPKIIDFYLPKILIILLIIFVLNSKFLKILFKLSSPKYISEGSLLKIYPRSIKFITDIPYTSFSLNKIKSIWKIDTPIDKIFKQTDTYLLGIELMNNTSGYQVSLSKARIAEKFLGLWGGSLSYIILLSIPNGDQFINSLSASIQNKNLNLFELYIFLSNFV